MKNKLRLNYKSTAVISVSIFLIALTAVGSFCDYEAAKALYIGQAPSENLFGVIFAFIGIIPTFVGWSFLGASILCLSKKHIADRTKRRWSTAFAILLFVLSFFYFCNTLMMVNANAFDVHFAVAYSVGIVTLLGAAYLGYKMAERSDNPDLLSKIILLSIVSVTVMIVIMSTKEIMDRPRYRFVLASENPDCFRNWWQSGSDIKALSDSALSDDFSSFPSGHSAYSMFDVFLFPAFADYNTELKKYRPVFAFSGFVWWCLTALSRITVGAHYLTDVSIAALLTVAVWVIAQLISLKILNLKQKRTSQ
jgi:membrane-associated phospholipid phosphatase